MTRGFEMALYQSQKKQNEEETLYWRIIYHPRVYANSAIFDPLLHSTISYIL